LLGGLGAAGLSLAAGSERATRIGPSCRAARVRFAVHNKQARAASAAQRRFSVLKSHVCPEKPRLS
jgi:hypothetical protein